MPMTMKKLAQLFADTDDEVADLLNPVRTSTQLEDIDDDINTVDKRVGRMVYNSTTGLVVVADSAALNGTWSAVTDGLVDHTPS